jgi:hypothetical protein
MHSLLWALAPACLCPTCVALPCIACSCLAGVLLLMLCAFAYVFYNERILDRTFFAV